MIAHIEESLPEMVSAGGFIREEEEEEERQSVAARPPQTAPAIVTGSERLSARQENRLIHHADQEMLNISRMYKNRAVEEGSDAVAALALDQLLAAIRSLSLVLAQIPSSSGSIAVAYLLSLLDMVVEYVRVFDRSPNSTFTTLDLMDNIFHKLLSHGQVTPTEKIRLKALIDRVRDAIFTKYEGLQDYEASCSRVFQRSIELI